MVVMPRWCVNKMVVVESRKNAARHRIAEVPRAVESCDAAGETLSNSEMRGLPGDLLVQTD